MEKNQYGSLAAQPLEVWAGLEYTLNRVGDRYFDQLIWSGHDRRIGDLDLIASLGVSAVRYPVLWERVTPSGDLTQADWRWTDERLNRLRELGLRPIAGLVHHGSGPRHTSLIDPEFPRKLAEYARAAAEQYPWMTDFTPVNEILTTARFSGLYGHWYPHGRDPQTFARVLLNEVRATQLAMQAIRQVTPNARLIQTDDLGKIYSTPELAYQAEHENHRRWLGYDLLCGAVDRHHPMHGFLLWAGANEAELEAIRADAVPPDVMGINYYITSERFLDDRVAAYPPEIRGGNGRHEYVDLEAVRVCHEMPQGFVGMMQEAWDRYHLPLAATEVHLGGNREDQLHWWMESWNGLKELRGRGVDIRAITAWSLLGAFHWDRLVTSDDGHYETGLFDARFSPLRPTVLARAVEACAKEGGFDHPVLDGKGWWRRPYRLLYGPVQCYSASQPLYGKNVPQKEPRKILVLIEPDPLTPVGNEDQSLGAAVLRACDYRGLAHAASMIEERTLQSAQECERILDQTQPWAVIDTTGSMDLSRSAMGQLCRERQIALLTFCPPAHQSAVEESQQWPVRRVVIAEPAENDPTVNAPADALVIYTSAGLKPRLTGAQTATVTRDLTALVNTCLDLLIDGEKGQIEVE